MTTAEPPQRLPRHLTKTLNGIPAVQLIDAAASCLHLARRRRGADRLTAIAAAHFCLERLLKAKPRAWRRRR
jgi:hypothetical protein